jgi:hypothetical protein
MDNKPIIDFPNFYARFNAPINQIDCGAKCAVHNPNGVPFCCDICHAMPAAYHEEWNYLQNNTDLWHVWKTDDCKSQNATFDQSNLDLPENMLLLACKGAQYCQREFRALSCRQFPFFPYVTADFRFLGLAYEWEFEHQCWVISHLDVVSKTYRNEFIATFDEIFNLWPEEMESYAIKSEEMRAVFLQRKQRIPILHRNGKDYLLSPKEERIQVVQSSKFRTFAPYYQQ